ncbi:MAG: hypothetical protein QM813_00125 [Verrucomicrobiota bacterium]
MIDNSKMVAFRKEHLAFRQNHAGRRQRLTCWSPQSKRFIDLMTFIAGTATKLGGDRGIRVNLPEIGL